MPTRDNGIGMTSPRARQRMVDQLRTAGIRDERVLDAMNSVPRHQFIDEALSRRAYDDTALPIGHGQTISQPYVIGRMVSELIDGIEPDNILEIGTGSGYQTAVLCRLAKQVFTVERIGGLYKTAISRLISMGVENVRFLHGDGYLGWPEYAPYDGIIVSAAPNSLPEDLLSQLKIGGRLVIPVGINDEQHLYSIERTADGFMEKGLEPVRFVPLRHSKQ